MRQRRIVFAVAGYAAIGMGHVYRALMLAREFPDCRVFFCCTKESEAYARDLIAQSHSCRMQADEDMAGAVLSLKPDLVINDLLDTNTDYMAALKAAGPALVNFEDLGQGAALADLVVNALYERAESGDARLLCGHSHFCLRDEFLHARRNEFRLPARRLLLTFGGTDPRDYTRLCLEKLYPECLRLDLCLSIVAGPGYAHKKALAGRIKSLDPEGERIAYTDVSNVMSREMEMADAAVCSAGRTVYELAHMRIPALVLAQHAREESHGFASPATGFLALGVDQAAKAERVLEGFRALMNPATRKSLHQAMCGLDFTKNKARVADRIRSLLSSA